MVHEIFLLKVLGQQVPVRIIEGPGKRRRQIVYQPEQVLVILPEGDGEARAREFLEARAERVIQAWRVVRERAGGLDKPGAGDITYGAKLLYRGNRRHLLMRTGGPPIAIRFRHVVHVTRPDDTTDDDMRGGQRYTSSTDARARPPRTGPFDVIPVSKPLQERETPKVSLFSNGISKAAQYA